MRRLLDFKDFKFLFEVIRMIYDENYLIEQQIYEVMVNEGHIVSIDEFFRINGIMLEETAVIKRSSRLSSISNNQLSILSREPIQIDSVNEDQTKDSKFF